MKSHTIPSELGKLSVLDDSFYISTNSFTGSIPTGELRAASYRVWLQHTYMHGVCGDSSIRVVVSILCSATTTHCDHAHTYAVHTELGQLTALETRFQLQDNSLTSDLPTQLGSLSLMTYYFRVRFVVRKCSRLAWCYCGAKTLPAPKQTHTHTF